MGHKVHPIGFRLGTTRDWQAKWFAGKPKQYRELLLEDMRIRNMILARSAEGAVSRVEIERSAHEVVVGIHTARPGIVIGRGGQRVEELRKLLEEITGKRVRLNIQEIRSPELDAYLVARNIADQLERRVSHRRAMKQAVARTTAAGGKGIKIAVGGRLAGSEIARHEKLHAGRVPLHTLRADIDFGRAEARTPLGRIGVKVWINRGEVMPEQKQTELAASAAAPAKPPQEATRTDASA